MYPTSDSRIANDTGLEKAPDGQLAAIEPLGYLKRTLYIREKNKMSRKTAQHGRRRGNK
jgi:hypothetical protein